MSIGIIGNGFVGGAVAHGFRNHNPLIYDIYPELSPNTLEEVMGCDYVFICLPTPMTRPEGGPCNIDILDDFLSRVEYTPNQVLIIKSTVPVGTTRKMAKKYALGNLIHNPEFLTAANAKEDFVNADRTVIGSPHWDPIIGCGFMDRVIELFQNQFPDTPVYPMFSDESELVKYTANCFLATKVMFFNEISKLAENLGINYEEIMRGVLSDPRINSSHTMVPGPDGNYGFGGTCFPKDINALIRTMKEYMVDPKILEAVWEDNLSVREDWDWAESESAVKENDYS